MSGKENGYTHTHILDRIKKRWTFLYVEEKKEAHRKKPEEIERVQTWHVFGKRNRDIVSESQLYYDRKTVIVSHPYRNYELKNRENTQKSE